MQLSALGSQPTAEAALDNGQHRRLSFAAHVARKLGDWRLHSNKVEPRQRNAGSEKELEEMEAWALGRVAQAEVSLRA